MLEKVERLITEINRIHLEYSKDYFETGKVEKVNLKHTFAKVPTQAILAYRLNLHEAINDYLMKANLQDIAYVYRVKTSESILDKINRFRSVRKAILLILFLMTFSVPVLFCRPMKLAKLWNI